MKQYFTGFFTALCLSASFVLFVGSQKKSLGSVVVDSIIVKGDDGSMTTIIGSGMITYNTNGKQSCYVGTADQGGGVIRTSNINGKETCYLGANILSNGDTSDHPSSPTSHFDLIFVSFNFLKLLLAKTYNVLKFSIV